MASSYNTEAEDDETNQEDMLSELPGDILLCILDRLELRDAVRTSALSRRWRHLPGLLSNIILNVGAFEPTDSLMFTLDDVDDIVLRSNADTVEETKNILAHKSTSVIKLLSLVFYLREGFIDIAHSINDAMANRSIVSTKFQLLSGTDLRQRMGDDNLICGKCLLSFFYTCPRAFGCLEHLVISNARFGDSDIPNMLSTCKKLEYLSLIRCDSGSQPVLQLEHPTLIHLRFPLTWIWIEPEHPKLLAANLQNLRFASLTKIHEDCDLTWTFFLLEAAPLLEDLHIIGRVGP
ncbi:putative F-box/FBD/LRR-repeat protein At5g56810 [Oryza brachyantha]|uniref:putative F-box/FBD/LRR-repeat protein At5g56810 n=1 Tax=Oryza brachyantha TaxID=4533 RepID=UPI001ADC7092|nr:putative F-box/FBD/LRR-repeat protein At5g56810 [Oryza brachyantha]